MYCKAFPIDFLPFTSLFIILGPLKGNLMFRTLCASQNIFYLHCQLKIIKAMINWLKNLSGHLLKEPKKIIELILNETVCY